MGERKKHHTSLSTGPASNFHINLELSCILNTIKRLTDSAGHALTIPNVSPGFPTALVVALVRKVL